MKNDLPLPFVFVWNLNFKNCVFMLAMICGLGLQVQSQNLPLKQWDKTFGGPVDDYLRAIVSTADGGYLLGGYSFQGLEGGGIVTPKGLYDYLVVKIDRDGNKEWEKMYGGDNYDFLYSIITTPDGGYLLGGYSLSGISGDKSEANKGGYDYWIIKLDQDGNKEWDKTYGGSEFDFLYSATATSDGGYLLAGNSSSGSGEDKSEESRGSADYWIIKIDEQGSKQWDKTYGGEEFENFRTVISAPDGGYLLGGYTQSGVSGDKSEASRGAADYWIVKIDDDGNKIWDKTFGGSNLDELTSMVSSPDGGYLLGGDSYSREGADKTSPNRGFNDYWIVKINADGKQEWDRSYGGTGNDYLTALIAVDGGFYAGGSSGSGLGADKSQASKGELDYWGVQIDEQGNKLWDLAYGGPRSDNLIGIVEVSPGEYLFAGQSNSGLGGDKTEPGLGSYDFWLVKSGTAVAREDQEIEFDEIADHVYGDEDFQVNATSSSGLDITYSVVSGPATIDENTVTITGAGIVTISASQEGNADYNPASSVSRTFTVFKATPVITWEPLPLTENDLLGNDQLNATATFNGQPVEGSFVYSPAEGTALTEGLQVLTAAFIPADSANFDVVSGITTTVTVESLPSAFEITSLWPASGSVQSFVFITGRRLGRTAAVKFNDVPASFQILNSRMIMATVPPGASTGLVTLSTPSGKTSTSKQLFTIQDLDPAIYLVSPASGKVGEPVTILGEHLGETTQVYFNDIPVSSFKVINAYYIRAIVPEGASTGKIRVVTADGSVTTTATFAVTGKAETDAQNLAANSALMQDQKISASVFPNPFKNSFTVNLKERKEAKVPAKLYNMEGKEVLRLPNISSGQRIYVDGKWPAGIYFLQVGMGNNMKQFKLVKTE